MWKVFYGTYAFFGKMLKLSSVALGGDEGRGQWNIFLCCTVRGTVLAPGDATREYWWTNNNAHAHHTK